MTSDPLGISSDGHHNIPNPMLLKKRPAEEIVLGPATKKMILTYVIIFKRYVALF